MKDPQDYTARQKAVGGRRTTRDTKYAPAPTDAALAHMKNLTVDGLGGPSYYSQSRRSSSRSVVP